MAEPTIGRRVPNFSISRGLESSIPPRHSSGHTFYLQNFLLERAHMVLADTILDAAALEVFASKVET
jgi:hypothetical protein